jgi:hypothetical protein
MRERERERDIKLRDEIDNRTGKKKCSIASICPFFPEREPPNLLQEAEREREGGRKAESVFPLRGVGFLSPITSPLQRKK